jgi:NAD(P)-dependent dehydrogenase (short-subunit alcohol dehydrogenase family)
LSSAASKNSGTNRPCQIKDQSGRTFIVTGANSGLGFETARQLAAHGGRVVLATRSERKGVDAVAQLKTAPPDADVEFRALDLADLDSGRALSAAILRDGIAVDVLINNAGVMYPPRRLTSQGFGFQFASHHLDHFALTRMLFDTIRRGRDARVVTVSSAEHQGGSIHFDNLTGERPYSPRAFDQQSKFANVLLGLALDHRVRAAGIPVRSVLAHPGYSNTNLQSSGPRWGRSTSSTQPSTRGQRAPSSTARPASVSSAAIRPRSRPSRLLRTRRRRGDCGGIIRGTHGRHLAALGCNRSSRLTPPEARVSRISFGKGRPSRIQTDISLAEARGARESLGLQALDQKGTRGVALDSVDVVVKAGEPAIEVL